MSEVIVLDSICVEGIVLNKIYSLNFFIYLLDYQVTMY